MNRAAARGKAAISRLSRPDLSLVIASRRRRRGNPWTAPAARHRRRRPPARSRPRSLCRLRSSQRRKRDPGSIPGQRGGQSRTDLPMSRGSRLTGEGRLLLFCAKSCLSANDPFATFATRGSCPENCHSIGNSLKSGNWVHCGQSAKRSEHRKADISNRSSSCAQSPASDPRRRWVSRAEPTTISALDRQEQ
jgi:hypothetical protein